MRAQEFVTELFEPSKKNWEWTFKGSEEAIALFRVGDIEYMFHAYGTYGVWAVEFKQNDDKLDRFQKFGLTGTGNSAEVMSTVADIMREFLTKYKNHIQTLSFSAKEDSRQALYARMSKRLLPDWSMTNSGGDFVLVAPEQAVAAANINEARNSLFAFVKQQFPTWPDYVLKDFLYQQAKGIRDQAELDDFLKRNKQDFGNCKWTLIKLPITFNIFTPKTQRMLTSREGGSSNPFQVPRDAERHAQQSQMIQQKGVSTEPIIVAKLSNGYDLIEGWHRTIQHLKAFPEGYTGPAWVCTGATYTSESTKPSVTETAGGKKYPIPLPIGDYLGDDSEEFAPLGDYKNTSELHGDINRLLKAGVDPKVVSVDPKKLLATQDWLRDGGGYGPLLPKYADKPVIYKKAGKLYILDGHHRSTQAFKAGQPISVYLFTDDQMNENFADGKVKGKSRPGRVKRAGASCNGSVTDLRARAKNASGERARMYHWCANMKSGKNK